MNEADQLVCDFAVNFYQEHFDYIEYDLEAHDMPHTKETFLEKLKTDVQFSGWCLFELAHWGLQEQHCVALFETLCEYEKLEAPYFRVYKMFGKYIKRIFPNNFEYRFEIVQPKTKTVVYFD